MFETALRRIGLTIVALALSLTWLPAVGLSAVDRPEFKTADIGHGITLQYVEEGTGTPLIFVHGSLTDYGYWKKQVETFSQHYRAIAYSRRYNFPNVNPARSGYSAIVDANDLVAFIKKLGLGKVDIIGHSYGALTALFLAQKHPELVRKLVLADPPAVSLLTHLPAGQAKLGDATFADIQRRMVAPMKVAFRHGDRDAGVAIFIDYVFDDAHAWQRMPESDRQDTLRNAREWDIMMTTGQLFPAIEPDAIRKIKVPVLIMSGAKTYPFLTLIDRELARLLPNNQYLVIPGAGHQMWYQRPNICSHAVQEFFGSVSRAGVQKRVLHRVWRSERSFNQAGDFH